MHHLREQHVSGEASPDFTTWTVHALFERQARSSPTAIALQTPSGTISYAELNAWANRLAHRLLSSGLVREQRVGLLVERSAGMVAGMLAVLKAGGSYVPLDPGLPEARLRDMAASAQMSLLLTDGTNRPQAERSFTARTRLLDVADAAPANAPDAAGTDADPGLPIAPDALAYVMFTSGSTGRPKGVMVEHRSVANRLLWMTEAGHIGPTDRVLQRTPFAFDASVWEIFCPLICGARLCIAAPGGHRDPAYHVEVIRAWQITVVQMVPSFLRLFLAEDGVERCTSLRRVYFGGEAAPAALLAQTGRLPARFFNLYGPTETCIDVTCWPCETPPGGETLPIGVPNANVSIAILGEDGRLLPRGEIGEIVVAGPCVARGYIGAPDATQARFVPSPLPDVPGRAYRTGDLGRIRADGTIEFHGRIDDQIKIGGVRIEPAEIENALAAHPEVAQAVVGCADDGAGPHLVAFVVPKSHAPALVDTLAAQARERLPARLVPRHIVLIDAIPRTPSGKTDLARLLAERVPSSRHAPAPPPRPLDSTERLLADLCAGILGHPTVSGDADLLDLGCDSLAAVRIAAEVRRAFRIECSVMDVFDARSAARLAELVSVRSATAAPPAAGPGPSGERRQAPAREIGPARLGIWLHLQRLGPGSPAYNVPYAFDHSAGIDCARLERALVRLADRHEALRGRLAIVKGRPEIDASAAAAPRLLRRRLREGEHLEAALAEEAARPIDLQAGPPLRAVVIEGTGTAATLLVFHHIAVDDASLALIGRDLGDLYSSDRDGEVEAGSRPDYGAFLADQAAYLASPGFRADLDYWRRSLAGADTTPALPQGRPDTGESGLPCRIEVDLGPGTAARCKAVARAEGVTDFMVLLSAFAHALSAACRTTDLVVGTPAGGRTAPATEAIVGPFANLLALRIADTASGSFSDLLARVRRVVLEGLARQDVPFIEVVRALAEGTDGAPDLVQATFAHRVGPLPAPRIPGVGRALDLPAPAARFPIEMEVIEDAGRLRVRVAWQEGRTDRAAVRALVQAFRSFLGAALEAPGTDLGALPLLSLEERRRIAGALRASAAGGRGIAALLERIRTHDPDRVAVEDARARLTYGELTAAAGRLAHELRRLGAGRGRVVAVCLPPGVGQAVAQLASLETGAAFLPLDAGLPEERLRGMVERAGCVAVVADGGTEGLFPAASAVLRVEATMRNDGGVAGARGEMAEPAGPDDAAYVIFTSGSTGRPKAVEVPARGLVNLVDWHAAAFGPRPGDRASRIAGCGFDAAVWELWPNLAAGATVCYAPADAKRSPAALRAWLVDEAITVAFLATPLAEAMLDGTWPAECRLRLVLTGGDRLVRRPSGREPYTLVNNYGPTECSVVTTSGPVAPGGAAPLPDIGTQIDGCGLVFLDAGLRPVPDGMPGELAVGGRCVANGYLGDPEPTAQAFRDIALDDGPRLRVYRTGDLCRRLPSGTVEFLGRIDGQLQIRGHRIEPAEIETALARHAAVAACAVVDGGDGRTGPILTAFATLRPGETVGADALRQWLGTLLPSYMVPGPIHVVDALPLTPSGKVDRLALRRSDPGGALAETFADPVDARLAALWTEVVGSPPERRDTDFFGAGGHSLAAMKLIARIDEEFGTGLALSDLYRNATIAGLAALVAQGTGRATADHAAAPPAGPVPLAPVQLPVLAAARLGGDEVRYNAYAAFRTTGPLSVETLAAGFVRIVNRHDALRSVLVQAGGEAALRVEARLWPRIRLRILDGGERDEAEFLNEACHQRFDPETGPIASLDVARLPDGRHLVVIAVHHLFADGWSMRLMLEQLAEACSGGADAAGPSYLEFARWSRERLSGPAGEEAERFWRAFLVGMPARLELPARAAHSPDRHVGRAVRFRLGAAEVEALARLGADRRASLYAVLLTGFALVLERYGAGADFPVGMPVANRTRSEFRHTVGLLANMVPVRCRLGSPRDRLGALVESVGEAVRQAQQWQELPITRIAAAAGLDAGRTSTGMLQVLFSLLPEGAVRLALPGLEADPILPELLSVKLDLALVVEQASDGGIDCALEYPVSLFDPGLVARMAGHLATAWRRMPDAVDEPWSALPIQDDHELAFLMGGRSAAPRPAGGTVTRSFLERVTEAPDHVAVAHGASALRFGELEAATARLAGRLRRLGVERERLVGICVRPGIDMVVAVLAVLRAGGACLPLDPDQPVARLRACLAAADPMLVLGHEATRPLAPELGRPFAMLDDIGADAPSEDPAGIDAARPEDLAYVIFTSGSTGRPKGVMIEHRGLHNVVSALIERLGVGPGSRLLQFVSLGFDVAFSDIGMALAAGATLCVVDRRQAPGGPILADEIRRRRVTHLQLPAPVLASMPEDGLDDLQVVVSGGEVLSEALARRWRSGRRVFNAYGPTEASVCATLHECGDEPGDPPIGPPLANVEVYLLDAAGRPVPQGVAGEICIAGDGLARGYAGTPELTAAAFVELELPVVGRRRVYRTGDFAVRDAAGALRFAGRRDGQVKVLGHRLELDEIRSCLAAHPLVRDAVVVPRKEAGGIRLAAYVVPREETWAGADELRDHLRRHLPEAAVPAGIVMMRALPLTANGKVDRDALPPPPDPAAGTGAPAGDGLVRAVLDVWRDVLGRPDLPEDGDFFEAGGHSLSAATATGRLSRRLGRSIALRTIFDAPTARRFAAALDLAGDGPPPADPAAPAVPDAERGRPSPAQEEIWFASRLGNGAAYNVPAAYLLAGEVDAAALEAALRGLVAGHEALLERFPTVEGRPVRELAPVPETVLEIAAAPLRSREAAAEAARLEARHPFDLAHEPPFRFRLLPTTFGAWLLLLTFHHIVVDGWSVGLLMRDLERRYAALRAGKVPDGTTGARPAARPPRLGEARRNDLRSSWAGLLAGASPLLLPLRAEPEAAPRGSVLPVDAPPEVVAGLTAAAARAGSGTTLFHALLAAFAVSLHGATGQQDLLIGTDVANRSRPDAADAVGLLVNQVPVRIAVSPADTVGDLLRRCRSAALLSMEAADLPFGEIVDAVKPPRRFGRIPLVGAKLVLQPPVDDLSLDGLAAVELPADTGAAKFDILVSLRHLGSGALAGRLEYRADLLEPAAAERLRAAFARHAASIARLPDATVADLLRAAREAERERAEHRLAQQDHRRAQALRRLAERRGTRAGQEREEA